MISKKPLFSWVLERYRGLQALLLLMILATIFFRVFPLEMQKRIINSAIPFKKFEALYVYCALYIGAVVLAGALKYLINVLQGYIGQKILYRMRTQLYDHILTLPLSFFRRTPPGMVIASLTSELSAIGEFMGGSLAIPIINILTLLTFAGYLAYLNPLLAVLSFAIYPIEIVIIPLLQNRFNRLNQSRVSITRTMSNIIGEAISGMHEIHGNASYQLESQKLERVSGNMFSVRHRMNIFKYLIKFANNFFQSLGPFILFLVGGYLTMKGRLDLGALVAFLSAYEKLYDPWKELMDYYQDLQDSRLRYKQVVDYFDLEPEFELMPLEDREPCRLTGQMNVSDLSLMVDGRIRLLDQISFTLESGEQLGLVGLSGSGKSTLAMVLGQLYSYHAGHVKVNGKELKTLTKLDVSHNIGYVAQQPFIFDGTLLENLLYACHALSDTHGVSSRPLPGREEILEAIHAVGLSDDVIAFGLGTLLSRDRHRRLARKLIGMRETFFRRWGKELSEAVDCFDENRFQLYTSIADNIIFGYPNREDYKPDQLFENPRFRQFLKESGLVEPLVQLGIEIATQTVSLLKGLEEDAFFFEMSPIPAKDLDRYSGLLDRLTKTGSGRSIKQDQDEFLKLALRFIPAEHKMAVLPPPLASRILEARREFMDKIYREDPEAFTFYRSTEYLFTQNILENILFGHPKLDHPSAMEQVRQKVIELLEEEGLLEEVMQAGLDFQVGSKGDRLSGGQRQKLALARALLKKPPILILDEATASLDNTSQAKIQHLFNTRLKGKCTLIAVAHRLEMVRDYDLIAVMKAGRIVEIGQYEELMARKGLFYELAHGSS
jgi:putative ABC transport system ATP-binding protein